MQSWPTMATWSSRRMFADGVEGSEGAGIGGGGDEEVTVVGVALEEVEDELAAGVADAAPVEADEAFGGDVGDAAL